MAEQFPNLGRDLDIQLHKADRLSENFNLKQSSLIHIVIKLIKIKNKERILKAARENKFLSYKGILHKAISGFLSRNLTIHKRMGWYIQSAERKKTCQPKTLYLAKLSFRNEGKIKTFPNKQKLREFITTRPALQEMLKKILQAEMKTC